MFLKIFNFLLFITIVAYIFLIITVTIITFFQFSFTTVFQENLYWINLFTIESFEVIKIKMYDIEKMIIHRWSWYHYYRWECHYQIQNRVENIIVDGRILYLVSPPPPCHNQNNQGLIKVTTIVSTLSSILFLYI